MIRSNVMPAGGVVIVTSYVTVHPSMVESFTVDLSTLASRSTTAMLTTIVPSPTRASISSRLITASFSSAAVSSSMLPSSAALSATSIAAFPSGTAAPEYPAKSKLWSDHLAALSLAAIILGILLLLSLMIYAITQRLRGKCHSCIETEKELAKYKTGELKHISPAMVKAREQCEASFSQVFDLEMGPQPTSSQQRESHRQDALAALQGPPSSAKVSIWNRTKGAAKSKVKGKGKGKAPQASEDEERTIGGPVYNNHTVYNEMPVESVCRATPRPPPPVPAVQDYDADSLYAPPSPSVYSRPKVSDVGCMQEQEEQYTPAAPRAAVNHQPTTYSTYLETTWHPRNEEHLREQVAATRDDDASMVSSALNINDSRHRVRYEEAKRVMERGARGSVTDSDLQHALNDVNAVEKQMRKKRRSRAYGGLPHPREFDDVDTGGGH